MKLMEAPNVLQEQSEETFSVSTVQKAESHGLLPREIFSKHLAFDECVTFRAEFGHAWVTMENDAVDYVLDAQTSLRFFGPGLLVVEALEHGVIFDVWS